MGGVVEHARAGRARDRHDPLEPVREQHQRAAERDQRRPLALEELRQRVDVDVVRCDVVGQLDDAVAADPGSALRVVVEVPAGPARQGGDRADLGQRRVDGEVGDRGARDARVRVAGAHRRRPRRAW